VVVPSYHYMIGPASAFLALGVIVLISRWVFSTKGRDERIARARAAARARGDFGLLVPVATTRTPEDAVRLRERLLAADIRCTVADGDPPGTRLLLVFRSDARRADELVRSG
jgi:hypothetical protein